MEGIKFIRYCQNQARKTLFNFRKLQTLTKEELKGPILEVSKLIEIAPVMVVRHLLKLEGFSKLEVKEIVEGKILPPDNLKESLEIALRNDPVFSPKGIKYGKARGNLGEDLIAEWLDSLSIEYERDIGQGGPDFLLKKSIQIAIRGIIKEFEWIESKASYGDAFEIKRNKKQFNKYDIYGRGLIFYWFGTDQINKYKVFTWENLIERVDIPLKRRILKFITFIPPEFKHLIS